MPMIGLSRPKQQIVSKSVDVGDKAPGVPQLDLQGGPYCVAFLRHVGCPFAEATVRTLRDTISNYPGLTCVVVTHGDRDVAQRWFEEIGGHEALLWHHDADRSLYGEWGIGYSGLGHIFSRSTLAKVSSLRKQGIKNRDASGTRWQRSAAFLVNDQGVVTWKHFPAIAGEIPVLEEAVSAGD